MISDSQTTMKDYAAELVAITERAMRLQTHIAEMNDARAHALLAGYDWLSEQYVVALKEANAHLKDDYIRIGELMVMGCSVAQ